MGRSWGDWCGSLGGRVDAWWIEEGAAPGRETIEASPGRWSAPRRPRTDRDAVWGSGAVGGRTGRTPRSPPTGRARAPGPPARPGARGGLRRALVQIVLDAGSAPFPPFGLEPAAERSMWRARSMSRPPRLCAGSVAHRDWYPAPRSIGCSPPEPACRCQTTKTHFEEDVRFACDGGIAFAIGEFRGPKAVHRFTELHRASSYVDSRPDSTSESHDSPSGPRKTRRITVARAFNRFTRPCGVTARE